MEYLLVLDPDSPIGIAYLKGSNDGTSHGQPVLNCTALDNSHPHYLLVERSYRHEGESRQQRLQVPHHAVAFVVEFDTGTDSGKTAMQRFGFQP
ncbi:hypothetical protein GGR77_001539 [Xanthomonas translucens]